MLPDHDLARARTLFPHIAQGKIYLNHAGTSPLSTRVLNQMMAHLHARSQGDIDTHANDVAMVNECRVFIRKLINAESPDRIALMPNTTDGINTIAAGMRWQTGDRILLNDIEFPANVWPYCNLKRLGVEIDLLKSEDGRITPEMIEKSSTPKTRLLALSAVQFLSGYRADLESIGSLCRRRGIVFAVDGIQAVGAVRIDVQRMNIDALAAGSQKWQMAPQGTGFLYVTEALQAQITQATLGWLGVDDPWDFLNYNQPLASTARRYEGGTLNMLGFWGLHAALATLLEFGVERTERHILSLTGRLIDQLRLIPGAGIITGYPEAERAGIVTVKLPAGTDEQAVFKRMIDRKVTAAVREGSLRFSPHFYNTEDDIIRAVDTTRECLTSP